MYTNIYIVPKYKNHCIEFFPWKIRKLAIPFPLPTWQQFRKGMSSPCCPNHHHSSLAQIWLAVLICMSRLGLWSLSDLADPTLSYVWIILPQHEGLGQGVKDGGPGLGFNVLGQPKIASGLSSKPALWTFSQVFFPPKITKGSFQRGVPLLQHTQNYFVLIWSGNRETWIPVLLIHFGQIMVDKLSLRPKSNGKNTASVHSSLWDIDPMENENAVSNLFWTLNWCFFQNLIWFMCPLIIWSQMIFTY